MELGARHDFVKVSHAALFRTIQAITNRLFIERDAKIDVGCRRSRLEHFEKLQVVCLSRRAGDPTFAS